VNVAHLNMAAFDIAFRSRGLRTSVVLVGTLLSLTACVPLRQGLPEATQPGAVCIYEALKSAPGIIAVYVYVSKDTPIIEYSYYKADGTQAIDDLYISLAPNSPGRYHYVGNFMDDLRDPVIDLQNYLASKCQADGYWEDQVIVTNQPKPVERRIRVVMPD
jgi:hypothetical protein